MTKPTLVFIPGFWEGPTAFSKIATTLTSQHAYATEVIPLPSTGTSGSDAKTFPTDVAFIRAKVQKLVHDGIEIIFIMHSAGAYIGSQAIRDLGLSQRKSGGEAGGVKTLVYLSGALLPEGSDHPPQPLFQITVCECLRLQDQPNRRDLESSQHPERSDVPFFTTHHPPPRPPHRRSGASRHDAIVAAGDVHREYPHQLLRLEGYPERLPMLYGRQVHPAWFPASDSRHGGGGDGEL